MPEDIPIKTKQEIRVMRVAAKKLAQIMEQLQVLARPGITTKELDRAAERLIFKSGAEPAFKGYEGFPATLCTSLNHQVVHSVPSGYKLKLGDMLSLDLGLKFKGFFADMAVTVIIDGPEPEPEAQRLLATTKKALKLAIDKVKPGRAFGDLSHIIQKTVEDQGFNVVRQLCGHGIGRELHQPPEVPNFGKRGRGPKIKAGMVFCPEPMTTIGDWRLRKSADNHGFETKDGSLSCHFEHTVLVTPTGSEILTAQ